MDTRQYTGARRNCLYAPRVASGCVAASLCPSLPYVSAYVNPQEYTGLVSMDDALERGSSFNNLYWPYDDRQKA